MLRLKVFDFTASRDSLAAPMGTCNGSSTRESDNDFTVIPLVVPEQHGRSNVASAGLSGHAPEQPSSSDRRFVICCMFVLMHVCM